MIITCSYCQTRYRVDERLIKETGTRVRCSNCQHVFTVFLPHAVELDLTQPIPRAPASQPGPQGGQQSFPNQDLPDYESFNESNSPAPQTRVLTAKPIVPATADFMVPGDYAQKVPETNVAPKERPNFQDLSPAASRGVYLAKGDTNPSLAGSKFHSTPDLGLADDPTVDQRQYSSYQVPPPTTKVSPEEPFDFDDGPAQGSFAYQDTEPRFVDQGQDTFYAKEAPSPTTLMAPLQPRRRGPSSKTLIILGSVIVVTFLVIGGFLFMGVDSASSPEVAIQNTGPDSANGPTIEESPLNAENATTVSPEIDAKSNLYFSADQTTHHYRANDKAGDILIITGRMTNGYDHPRSFIKVKAILKNSAGTVVAEREAFAGNYLTEGELVSLSMQDILTRLAIKGGQNSSNINVNPGSSIPFMLVFDKLPPDLAEYVVVPVSSAPTGTMAQGDSEEQLGSLEQAPRDGVAS
ncbi:MAG: zinc-ribbon domain-containing protein [Deltaproteobacteria bacterium]|nr:zinc-ribbon domain-containing protein [Deltaproteobacteria bacterium]